MFYEPWSNDIILWVQFEGLLLLYAKGDGGEIKHICKYT